MDNNALILAEYASQLPESLQYVLTSGDVGRSVQSIGEANDLRTDQLTELYGEFTTMVMGFTHPDAFPQAISKRLAIDPSKARTVASQITELLSVEAMHAIETEYARQIRESNEQISPPETTANQKNIPSSNLPIFQTKTIPTVLTKDENEFLPMLIKRPTVTNNIQLATNSGGANQKLGVKNYESNQQQTTYNQQPDIKHSVPNVPPPKPIVPITIAPVAKQPTSEHPLLDKFRAAKPSVSNVQQTAAPQSSPEALRTFEKDIKTANENKTSPKVPTLPPPIKPVSAPLKKTDDVLTPRTPQIPKVTSALAAEISNLLDPDTHFEDPEVLEKKTETPRSTFSAPIASDLSKERLDPKKFLEQTSIPGTVTSASGIVQKIVDEKEGATESKDTSHNNEIPRVAETPKLSVEHPTPSIGVTPAISQPLPPNAATLKNTLPQSQQPPTQLFRATPPPQPQKPSTPEDKFGGITQKPRVEIEMVKANQQPTTNNQQPKGDPYREPVE